MTAIHAHPGLAARIGVARRDITPPAGIYSRNWGAAVDDVAIGVHRPMTLTALSIATGDGSPLVIVAMDLGWWRTAADEWRVRGALIEQLGLPRERVLTALTHTHAGPSIAPGDAALPGGALVEPYVAAIAAAALAAVREAMAAARPATLDWSLGQCGLARNRDLPDPARPRDLCGFNPDGGGDGTVVVGRAVGDDGRAIATLVNYACHPTTLAWENRLISPDYVGAMRELVEGHTGAPCLFLQGPSGDQAPRDQYTGDAAVADRNGRELGFAVLATLTGMIPAGRRLAFAGAIESGAPLAAWRQEPAAYPTDAEARVVEVPLALKDMPTLAEIERERAACADRVIAERLRRKGEVRRTVGDGVVAPTPLWVWRLGDAFIVAQPNEAYAELQGELRRRFPGRVIVVAGLVSGVAAGYLPPRGLYGRDIYQVWQTPFAAGGMEQVIEAAAQAIASLAGEDRRAARPCVGRQGDRG